MSHTTKEHGHPPTISAPSSMLQYSRKNNDSHIPPLPRRGKCNASPAYSSISATRTGPSSSATLHSASPTVSVLSSTSHSASPFAHEQASSSRTMPSSSLPRSSSFATTSSNKAIPVTSLQHSSPGDTCLAEPLTPLFCTSREESTETDAQHLVSDSGPSIKYLQALSIMTPMFRSAMSQTILSEIIRTGDLLLRDNAVLFLRDQLPLWPGMWDPLDLRVSSSEDSIADHFVKISRSISVLEGRTHVDLRILLYRILQYQYYVRIVDEIEKSKIQK
jgi:hypothetical protein